MSEITGKRRKIHVDHTEGKSKNSLIHGPQNSSDECKVLGYFGSKYVKSIPTKDRGHNPVPGNKFNRQKDNNAIVNSAVDEILLNENKKVSAEKEAPAYVESNFDENELYQIDNMSLDETKEKLDCRKCAFECKLKNIYGIENHNDMNLINDK